MKVKYTIVAGALVAIIGVGGVASPAGATSVTKLSQNNDSLVQDMIDISTAASHGDVEEVATACESLGHDAITASTYTRPKILPKAAWRHMKAAWALFISSASLCSQGARSFDPDQLSQAIALLEQGSSEIKQATELIGAK